jgi:type IV pilus assembly protein PilA
MNIKDSHADHREKGFTLIELMVVIAIIGIMASLAVPSFQDRIIRAQVSEGLGLADFAKQAVATYYAKTHNLPQDNEAAGLPPANRIVGNNVSSVMVHSGAIDITFGNQANHNLAGKTLTVRPATVTEYPQVPIAWICGMAAVPQKMTVNGANATDLPGPHLPLDCRTIGR